MKNIKSMKNIFLGTFLVALMITGCEDMELLDRPQLNSYSDETFWNSETNLRLYANEFYPQFFVGYNSGWTADYSHWIGSNFGDDFVQRGTQIAFDNQAPASLGSGANTANAAGTLTAPAWRFSWQGPTWYFGWIRKANLMIDRIENNMKESDFIVPDAKEHWIAVGRFFKALDYCRLVSVFGDVPYFDANFSSADRDIMYKDRDPRNTVMDKIYDDFKYVMANMRVDDGVQFLNRYVAAGFISRWMLFEGTWQQYHNSDAARAKKFLDFSVEASEYIMDRGNYAIETPMHEVFGSDNLVDNKECILYRQYVASLVTHAVLSYNLDYEGQDRAANLAFVKNFICNDGEVWQNSSVADADKFDLANLIKTRDPRFEAYFTNKLRSKAASLLFTEKFASRAGAAFVGTFPPALTSNTNITDAPVVRYGEILLNWIEAKAVSGNVTQGDIDKSINLLRNRPLDATATERGVSKTKPMDLTALPDDPNRDADVPQLIWEIRRERRMELYGENPPRLLDLKRWKKLDYMKGSKNPDLLRGIWVDLNNEPLDVNGDPVELTAARAGIARVEKADGTVVTFDGTNHADMVGWYVPDNVQDRPDFTDRLYTSPVGQNQIDLYEHEGYKLTQTKDW